MYYILNKSHQLIAADEALLNLCGFSDINTLNKEIILDKITFQTHSDTTLNIKINSSVYELGIKSVPLSTVLGELTLVIVEDDIPISFKKTPKQSDIDIDIESLIIKNEVEDKETRIIHDITKEIPSLHQEDIEKTKPIYINKEKISQEIGVSAEDFNTFLNDYISTALELEEDLKSTHTEKEENAIKTLSHLSNVLHLDTISGIIQNISTSTEEKKYDYIDAFYSSLSRITTKKPENIDTLISPIKEEVQEENKSPAIQESKDKDHLLIELDELPIVEPSQEVIKRDEPKKDSFILDLEDIPNSTESKEETLTQEKFDLEILDDILPEETKEIYHEPDVEAIKKSPKEKKVKSFGTLTLSEVTPIHFDFSIHTAADELSLPESLIEEFMLDFIDQAHSETDKMLAAYKKGDLEAIQKIGHLLKGVSSNLRITTLSDTLYNIQFCENPDDLESLIKNYWGHFLAFEKQIKPLAK